MNESLKARLLRTVIRSAFKLALSLPNSIITFQNADDHEMFIARGLVAREMTTLIRGSGVDVNHFSPQPEPAGAPLIVLPARMLWTKGVEEFVSAARALRAAGVNARFALVGDPDFMNRAAIPAHRLAEWKAEGAVECWGHQDDMRAVYAQAHIVCLPSYHEGRKALMEAAAVRPPAGRRRCPRPRDRPP